MMYEVGLLCVVLGLLVWYGITAVQVENRNHLEGVQAALNDAAEARVDAIEALDERLAWCHQWREDAITLIARLEQLPEITIVQGDGTIH